MTPNLKKLKAEAEENLLGDARERLLDAVKRHVDWGKVPEARQRALISAVEQVQRENIRSITEVTAGHGHKTIGVRVSGLKQDKDGNVESKIVADGSPENILGIFNAGRCVLVLADANVFMGERRASEVLKDQPSMLDETEDRAVDVGEGAHVAENTRRIEEGIIQLEDEGSAGLPAHDPLTGEIIDRVVDIGSDETVAAFDPKTPQEIEQDALLAKTLEDAAQPSKPRRQRRTVEKQVEQRSAALEGA